MLAGLSRTENCNHPPLAFPHYWIYIPLGSPVGAQRTAFVFYGGIDLRNRIPRWLFAGTLLFPWLSIAQDSPSLVLTTRISLAHVNGRMDHFAVDLKGQRLFIAAFDNHTVEVIDLQTGRQKQTIPNLNEPQGAFYDPATNRLFISSSGDGAVKIFDGSTFQLLRTVKLSSDADNIRYDTRNKLVLVGYGGEKFLRGKVARGHGDGALALLDSDGKQMGSIPVDAHPESFQLEKSGTRVFVNVPDRKEIEVADLTKRSVLAHWPVTNCSDNFPMTLDEAHHRLFVACRTPATLLVIDTETGKAVTCLEGANSDDIFYHSSKARIYVLGRMVKTDATGPSGPGFVDVFQQKDADHYQKIGSYPSGPGAGTGLFVPQWGKLFVAARQQGTHSAELLVYETR